MNDPNNHVPEVSPGDVWGDAHALHPRISGSTAILPPKRPKPRPKNDAPESRIDCGLRIDPTPDPQSTDPAADEPAPEPDFEVQEINGSVLRLDHQNAVEGPEKVKAAELPFQPRPAKLKDRNATDREWGNSKQFGLRWILGISLGVASLIIGGVMALPVINQSNATRPPDTHLEVDQVVLSDEDRRMEQIITRQFEAEQLFRSFATANLVDDFLPAIRNAPQLDPIIRANHHPTGLSKDWTPGKDTTWTVNHRDQLVYGTLSGKLPDYSPFRAYVVQDLNGTLLLDWKATTAYSTASFDELAKNLGDASEIRGLIHPEAFYTLAYPESAFQCYQLDSFDGMQSIWVYTEKDGETDRQIHKLFKSGGILPLNSQPKRITLSLKSGPADSLPNQWLIDQLLHPEWIQP